MSVSAVLQIAVPSFYPFTETCKCQFHIFAKPAPVRILLAVRMTQAVSRHPLNILAVYNRAFNEGSRRPHNHREDPDCGAFSWLKVRNRPFAAFALASQFHVYLLLVTACLA